MWFIYSVLYIFVLTETSKRAKCDAISNTNFNSHIRDYSTDDTNNITNIKTLQKEDLGKYATFTPTGNPIKFKEIPDSALSSSSNGRDLLYHDQPGYALNDYQEPHFPHGYDFHLYDPHPDIHNLHGYDDHHDHHNYHGQPNHYEHHDHHEQHDPHNHDHHYSGHHHLDNGNYNKHYKHALAAKTVLWPIAGLALLGAAAALVSNPVLLQLGVISGKRRRRDTEEITGPEFPSETFIKYADKIKKQSNEDKIIQIKENFKKAQKADSLNFDFKRRVLETTNLKNVKRNNLGMRKIRSSIIRNVDEVTTNYPGTNGNTNLNEERFIPVPIKVRTPHISD